MDISLNHKLSEIQALFKSKKSRFNSFGKYNFRSAEDILEALKPYLLKHDVTIRIKEKYLGSHVIKSTAIISDGVQKIRATAIVGVDTDQKGMQMPQKFGSASSYGKKYALGNLFLIDDTLDSDAGNTHGKAAINKAQLTKTTDPAFVKAKEYIKGGGKIEAIKQKYVLSKEVEQELQTL